MLFRSAGGDFVTGVTIGAEPMPKVNGIVQLPETMTPSTHYHPIAELTDFPETMPPSSHTHPATEINETELRKFITQTLLDKLNGIESSANNYTHPDSHSLDMIVETTLRKIMTADERTKLAGVAANANNYAHPDSHSLSMIVETELLKVMTAAERNKLNGIAANANNYVHPANHPASMITTTADRQFTSTVTHSNSGTVHTFTGLPTATGIYTVQFKATADFVEGNTFAGGYTAKPNGEETALPDKAFVNGDIVSMTVDTQGKKLGFKLGGGGGFPNGWNEKSSGTAIEVITRNSPIVQQAYGNWQNGINSYPQPSSLPADAEIGRAHV